MANDDDDFNDEPGGKKAMLRKSSSHTWYNFVVQSKQCVCASAREWKKRVPKMDFKFEKRNEQTNGQKTTANMNSNKITSQAHWIGLKKYIQRKTCSKKVQTHSHSRTSIPKEIERRNIVYVDLCMQECMRNHKRMRVLVRDREKKRSDSFFGVGNIFFPSLSVQSPIWVL